MLQTSRRSFLRGAAGAAALGVSAPLASAATTKIKMGLNTGNIGVRANTTEAIAMAVKYGFDAVNPNAKELAALSDSAMSAMLDDLASKKLSFGSCAQGFTLSQSDEAWAATLKDLHRPRKRCSAPVCADL